MVAILAIALYDFYYFYITQCKRTLLELVYHSRHNAVFILAISLYCTIFVELAVEY